MPSMLPPLGWHSLLHTWQLRPAWDLTALVLLAGYLGGLLVCRRHGVRAVHPARVGSFVAGLVLLVVTVSSAVDTYAMALFWDHMVEHLMLIMVVPALLVLGHPLTVLRTAAATRGRGEAVDRVLRSAPVAVLTHPVVGMVVYGAVIIATHLTSFMDRMVVHPWLMDAEQWLYLVSGYLFLLPLIGNEPIRWKLPHLGRVMLILLAMTPDTVVGIVLMQATRDPFPVMEGAHPMWALDPLRDVTTAGGLMWAGGDGLMMLMGIGIVIAMLVDPARDAMLGSRLENVRRRTLAGNVARADASAPGFADDVDVDEDDAVLDAYNRMLGRLGGDSS